MPWSPCSFRWRISSARSPAPRSWRAAGESMSPRQGPATPALPMPSGSSAGVPGRWCSGWTRPRERWPRGSGCSSTAGEGLSSSAPPPSSATCSRRPDGSGVAGESRPEPGCSSCSSPSPCSVLPWCGSWSCASPTRPRWRRSWSWWPSPSRSRSPATHGRRWRCSRCSRRSWSLRHASNLRRLFRGEELALDPDADVDPDDPGVPHPDDPGVPHPDDPGVPPGDDSA